MPLGAQGDFQTANFTDAINELPTQFGLINQLGVFESKGSRSTIVRIDRNRGLLSVLPALQRGAPAVQRNKGKRDTALFEVPHFREEYTIRPEDLQDQRAMGMQDAEELDDIRLEALQALRNDHDQTLEFLRVGCLTGSVVDGEGQQLLNLFTAFGETQVEVDFVLGTTSTDVITKVRELKRQTRKALKAGGITPQIRVLCSTTFFDKLTQHDSVKDTFRHFSTTTWPDPRIQDLGQSGFPLDDVIFQEYDADVVLADAAKTTQKFIADGDGRAFPTGVPGLFETHFAPANRLSHVNERGRDYYSWERRTGDDTQLIIDSEMNPFNICRKPLALIRCFSSN